MKVEQVITIQMLHLIDMKKNITTLLVLATLPICSYAQGEVKDTVSVDVQEIRDTVEEQTIDVVELQKKIKELTDKVNTLTESENNLKGKQFDDKQKIDAQEIIIKRLEQRLVFADSIVARLSNDCLRQKYDAGKVANAISNFDRMYSVELKSKFYQLKVLLSEYGKYTQEIENIFLEAQNDKAIGNPFTGQKQALTYIDKIKATSYYIKVYDNNWTIPYLNTVIDKSIEIIKSFNPKESKELHLIELMK
mgnify:CR=1 FL=1